MSLLPGRVPAIFIIVLFSITLGIGLSTSPVSGTKDTVANLDSAMNAPENGSELRTASATFDTDTGSVTADSTGTDIELTQELRRVPDRHGIFEANHRYRLPDQLRLLEVTVPDGASVVSLDGFIQGDGPRTYRWDGTTAAPGLTYRVQGNRSIDQTGPIAGPGQYLYVDLGEWAVVSQPETAHQWGWVGPDRIGFDRSVTVDGPGAVGDVMAYLGRYDSYTHRAHGQRFELIVPERADLSERPAEIFESLADASDTMRVGSRDDRVFMIATPTERIDWGVRGLQTGPSDIWVRDIERLDTADNVWLHEYVHSRQEYVSAPSLEWFTEGSASYYAALLSLEQDRISFSQFRSRLSIGTSDRRFGNSILSDPASWESNANYHVGPLVSGELDRQLRVETDGQQSLQEILRQFNAQDGVITGETLTRLLTATGGKAVAAEGERLTTTTERPAVWDESAHRTVFEEAETPALITYSLSKTDPLQVSGPYRNISFEADSPPVFVPGETVSIGVDATNFGEQSSEYTATLRVNDKEVGRATGQLGAGETEHIVFNHSFGQRGEYVLAVGDVELLASVRDPATPTVDSFDVDRTEITAGESVRLSALLSNPADRPALSTLRFTRDGDTIDTRSVKLGVDASETLSTETVLDEPGTYVFGLGETASQTAVVTVTAEPQVDDDATAGGDGTDSDPGQEETGDDETDEPLADRADEGTDETGIGFGIVAAIVAVLTVSYVRFRE